jgi:hypothetical protein
VADEIATIEMATRSGTEDIGHVRRKGIETEIGTGTEIDTLDQVVSAVDGAMSHEIGTESEIENLREGGEETMRGTETIGIPGVVGEEEETEIGIEGTGNDLEKRMTVGWHQEVEVQHEMREHT